LLDGKTRISLSEFAGHPTGRVRDVWLVVLDRLPEATQCLPRGYKLEASGSNVGKRQKQAQHHEKINDWHLKRDGAALIGEQGGQFVFSGQDRSFSHGVTQRYADPSHLALNALLQHDVLISLCFIGASIGDSNPDIVIRYEPIPMAHQPT